MAERAVALHRLPSRRGRFGLEDRARLRYPVKARHDTPVEVSHAELVGQDALSIPATACGDGANPFLDPWAEISGSPGV